MRILIAFVSVLAWQKQIRCNLTLFAQALRHWRNTLELDERLPRGVSVNFSYVV